MRTHAFGLRPLIALPRLCLRPLTASDKLLQEDWPIHPPQLVLPWAAGGGTDVMGKIMAHRMTEILGQPVIVENISGAGGMIRFVACRPRQTSDGLYLRFWQPIGAINMTLYKHPTYNLQNDLAPVVLVAVIIATVYSRAQGSADP